MHFKISANTRREGQTSPRSYQKRNTSKGQQRALGTPCLAVSSSPSQQGQQHAGPSPKAWHRGSLLHPRSVCQAACPSPSEMPSPQMSQARIGMAPREARAGFILAPCGPQHCAAASHGAGTLICCHPAPTLPICALNPGGSPPYCSEAGSCWLLYFSCVPEELIII